MNTLIVDDRQLAVNAMKKIMEKIDAEGMHIGVNSTEEALRILKDQRVDIAFLDIEMPGINGMDLAWRMKGINPNTNVIFVTGHSEYALEAHELYASGFLLKPVDEEDVRKALEHLRYPIKQSVNEDIWIQCFGKFEVFYKGEPLHFSRNKTKELFAYLIDQKGANCTMGELLNVLWENKPDSRSQRSQLRNLISDLKNTLEQIHAQDIIIRTRNKIAVDKKKVKCDYYYFLDGMPSAINMYHGEYMSQYSWAEITTAVMDYYLIH